MLTLAKHLDLLTIAVQSAANGGKVEIARKEALRQVLEDDLRDLALYVKKACHGSLPDLLLSGYPAQTNPRIAAPLPTPANLRLRHGNFTGQLDCRSSAVKDAAAYEWRYANFLSPADCKPGGTTVAARTKLNGLTPGTTYIVELRAIGTGVASEWSDPEMLTVL